MNTNKETQKLKQLIADVRFAMLSTVDGNGSIRSRPMYTLDAPFDGTLWFFTRIHSPKVEEIHKDQRVNINYVNPEESHFVSVTGSAEIIRDQEKINQFWKPQFKAWFPGGKEDPDLGLLRVAVEQAEYWDTASSTVVHLFGMIKAFVTGKPASGMGEHQKVNLRSV